MSKATTILTGFVLLCALAFAVYRVGKFWWVCDDAFLSFRYARNLARGLGLVYNAGERVEGYTNFLWTVAAAGAIRLRLDPVVITNWIGIFSYFGTVGVLLRIARYFDLESQSGWLFPVAAIGLLLHTDAHRYATGGLETGTVMFFVTSAFALLLIGQRVRSRIPAGLLLTAAALCRADALIFFAAGCAFVLWEGRDRLRGLVALASPMVLIYVPYWLWRFSYYGYPFPNTYYAKSANLPYWDQGWVYLWLYVKSYYVFLALPLLAGYLLWRNRKHILSGRGACAEVRALVSLVLFVVPYSVYVVRVGGDFMFARFWIPVTALLLVALELGLRALVSAPRAYTTAGTVVALLVFLRSDPWADRYQDRGIADEPAYYVGPWHSLVKRRSEMAGGALADYPARVAATGAVAYYSDVPWSIEIGGGLTDTAIAHRPLEMRGRPGHEKAPTLEDLADRGVYLILASVDAAEPWIDTITTIEFGGLRSRILRYDRTLMNQLSTRPDVRFVDLEAYLDSLLPHLGSLPAPRVREMYEFLMPFYFEHNADPRRQRVFEEILRESGTPASAT